MAKRPPNDLAGRWWLILGASSIIAREFAREVASRGAAVILAGRDLDELAATAADLHARGAKAEIVGFDARDLASHQTVLNACYYHVAPGELDIFVAFAAMPSQADMEEDPALAVATIEASYTGAVAILLLLAPLIEGSGKGRILVIGSVSGDRGRRKNFIYGSAKAGLRAFTAGLRSRLYPAGCPVTLIRAGFMDTAMTWGMPGIFLAASPKDAAQAMLEASLAGKDEIYYPRFWALIMFVIKSIPERIFKRLSI
jgi:decaprenylphospho-beta-D-erythro-pentofuranosid-2-ulose 2-reductase